MDTIWLHADLALWIYILAFDHNTTGACFTKQPAITTTIFTQLIFLIESAYIKISV
jgi:hypothetical protein